MLIQLRSFRDNAGQLGSYADDQDRCLRQAKPDQALENAVIDAFFHRLRALSERTPTQIAAHFNNTVGKMLAGHYVLWTPGELARAAYCQVEDGPDQRTLWALGVTLYKDTSSFDRWLAATVGPRAAVL